jgi:ubiquinone/menaquinone biosynthesis C-methylase UbiE
MNDKLHNNIENNYNMWNNLNNWSDGGEEWSVQFNGTDKLYDNIIAPRITGYVVGNVLEISPGHGRITRKLLEEKETYSDIYLDILDLSDSCIDVCREKFGDKISNYYVGDGKSLSDIPTDSKDFVMSYDSFVHMSEDVIDSYLKEIQRVLKPNGHCWVHHSHFMNGQENNFDNVSGRSNMTMLLFYELAELHKLKIISQEFIKWDGVDENNATGSINVTDVFSLCKKI